MTPKHDLINKVIQDKGYKSYLEVGFGNGHNFNRIKIDNKKAIEPEYKGDNKNVFNGTSDNFFKQNEETYDIVFIDGLHHADQVRKDLVNSMKYLSEDGAIVLHDSLPPSEKHQRVPREQESWTGDVWRAVVGFRNEYPDIEVYTNRSDYGLTFIYPQGKKYRKKFEDTEITYKEFDKNKKELLNIID